MSGSLLPAIFLLLTAAQNGLMSVGDIASMLAEMGPALDTPDKSAIRAAVMLLSADLEAIADSGTAKPEVAAARARFEVTLGREPSRDSTVLVHDLAEP